MVVGEERGGGQCKKVEFENMFEFLFLLCLINKTNKNLEYFFQNIDNPVFLFTLNV